MPVRNNAMRILAISNLYPPFHGGGYGVLCHRLCDCLSQAGHDVTILTSETKGENSHPGGHLVSLPVRRELAMIEGLNSIFMLWEIMRNKRSVLRSIRELNPDLVFCFGIDGVGYQVYHTAVESGVPSVTVAGDTWLGQAWRDLPRFDPWHALINYRNSKGCVRLAKRLIKNLGGMLGLYTGIRPLAAHPVYAISNFLIDDLKSTGMSWTPLCHLIKYPLLPPFVSEDGTPVGLDGSVSPRLRVLFVSRMEPLKGPDVAIKGVALAVRRGADVQLTLAGIGAKDMESNLRMLAFELGIGERVKWVDAPNQEALVALYRSNDVFVFPSLIVEGLGIVCLEAMACGLPVLATRQGGQLDLVKEGETGLTFASGDFNSLGNILASLSNNADQRRKLSCGAIAMAQTYGSGTVRKKLESWVKAVIEVRAEPND